MSNQIQFSSFNFNSNAVRVITDPTGEFWFGAKDVCDILGYQNDTLTIQKHCKPKGVSKRYSPTKGGNQEITFINEPNLYRLIIKSRKPEAEPFEAWVFEEVLPQIRKTGQYSLQNPQQTLPLVEEKKFSFEQTQAQWLRFASSWYALYNCVELLGKLDKPLHALGSGYAPQVAGCATEYQTVLGVMHRLLVPMFEQFEVDPLEDRHYYKALKTLREYQPKGLGGLVRI